jgi:hypothetical protein
VIVLCDYVVHVALVHTCWSLGSALHVNINRINLNVSKLVRLSVLLLPFMN